MPKFIPAANTSAITALAIDCFASQKQLEHAVLIRQATHHELEQIWQFEKAYFEEIEPAGQLEKWLACKSAVLKSFANQLEHIWVVEHHQQLVGYGYWSLEQNQPHIFSIYIQPAQRQSGLATQLIKKLEHQISANGFSDCFLSTRRDNPARFAFFKMNYQQTGEDAEWLFMKKSFVNRK